MWIHPDLIKDQQWSVSTSQKAKGKAKARSCNMIGVSLIEGDALTASLTDSDNEAMAADTEIPLAGTRSGKPFAKQYDEAAPSSSKPVEKTAEQPPKKQKELRFNKPLQKENDEGHSTPFRFNVLAQLANIPARITLYELLRLSKTTREALREALANSEAFSAHVAEVPTEEGQCSQCHQTLAEMPCISFSQEDMQVKGKHDRPLYFTGYIGSSEINRIQVDPGSALSIMPRRVLKHLGIPAHRLSATQTTIYGFNANGSRPLGKIRLKCQIGSLKSEVTCYVIDAETSYNLLLGRPWIHGNFIIPSTLHQVMKYAGQDGEIKTLIAEKQPFKGVENYFTDSVHYRDSLEISENIPEGEIESGNEADVEEGPEDDCPWELNPSALNVNDESGDFCWVINEEIDFHYSSNVSPGHVQTGTTNDPGINPTSAARSGP